MSDLDADLYGDLYGNDENEFVVPTEPEASPVKAEVKEPVKEEAKPVVKQEPQPIPTSTSSDEHNPYSPRSSEATTSAIPSYTSPPTQQIPIYQERQPDHREPAPPRHDSYQGAPGVDRPVRPSEMKEEG
ncbi:hypothetical protein L226DRAFT_574875 [Lentinus tigrinus ALCF2SS1-7]|uniref:Uncharacterized protein n=1 Tax=Lentinus tigrinus ALCF2SS1-6 TaxID=1328759 RepID=A0A5C2RUX5_9APHY|nr:hypothetical protein L227DRAFT_510521 [Lentinus tigrinus ALCF2SS1-6]RPD70354.1 hypothetical protein L226DRAFT_574875 [Lentinus tigrinus ALCF2SS1-7]